VADEIQERYMKPIVDASFPGIMAALSLTVFGIIDIRETPPMYLRIALLSGTFSFILSSFSLFFYGVYPTRKRLWTATALFFLAGLFASLVAVIMLLLWPPPAWQE
jgi:hypothetical protein